MNKSLLLLCFILWNTLLMAQYSINGIVFDKTTNEALPFVNIATIPNSVGTSSDINGFFQLKWNKKIKSIQFSFIGYKTLEYKITSPNEKINIYLEKEGIKIQETIISAKRRRKIPKDTAAITLYRNVVKHKAENRPQGLQSYQYKEHTKIEFDLYKYNPKLETRFYIKPFRVAFDYADTTATGNRILPILLQEEILQVYYQQKPERTKKIRLANMATGLENASASVIASDYFENIAMYDDLIAIGGKSFTSPFSKGALLSYKYFLSDSSTTQNGTKIYRLDFSPRNNKSIAFSGFAWIETKNFAIVEMEFRVPTKANLNFINEFYAKQKFTQPDGKHWFLTEEEVHTAANILKTKKNSSVLLQKRVKRDKIQINQSIEDTIFKGDQLIQTDSMALRDSTWWQQNRIAPLTTTEKNIFFVVDSIKRTRTYKDLQKILYFGTSGYARIGKKPPIEIGPIYKFYSRNSIEGHRLKFGFRTNKYWDKKYQFTTYVAYGTKDKVWKGYAGLRLMLPTKYHKWHTLDINYANDFTFLGSTNAEQKFNHDNIFLTLVRSTPLTKIMRIEEYKILHEKEWINGLSTLLGFNRKTFFPIENVFEFNKLNAQQEIESISHFNTTELSVGAKIEIGKSYFKNDYKRFSAGSKNPEVEITYTQGIKGLFNGKYAFQKINFKYFHRWNNILGYTRYTIKGGYSFGETPYPLLFMPQGNSNYYYNRFAFANMKEYEFAADRFASVWIDHHFDGKLLNHIPLIKWLRLRSIFSFKFLISDINTSNRNLILMPETMQSTWQTKDKVYAEIGFGVENILRLFRVDFTWRLTQRAESQAYQRFAIKFAIQPKL